MPACLMADACSATHAGATAGKDGEAAAFIYDHSGHDGLPRGLSGNFWLLFRAKIPDDPELRASSLPAFAMSR